MVSGGELQKLVMKRANQSTQFEVISVEDLDKRPKIWLPEPMGYLQLHGTRNIGKC